MTLYDRIGSSYSRTRRTDHRILARITEALEGCERVLNVGAGTGSYEPKGHRVIAVEPSSVMMKQRMGPFEGVSAVAEYLPFSDESFDAAMGVHTIQHWTDKVHGLREMRRVVKDRIVMFTWDQTKISRSWLLGDYFPASKVLASRRSVPIGTYRKVLGGSIDIIPVPVPWDCMDGSDGAYWRRPSDVLRESVWQNLSILTLIPPDERDKGMHRLALELGDGTWKRKYGHLLKLTEFDYGYLLVVWRKR